MNLSTYKKYLFGFLGLVFIGYLIKEATGNGDFKVFLEAAKLISKEENPYSKWILVSEENYALYFYSPLWALLLIPFSSLPNFFPNLLWLLASCFFLYRTWTLIKEYFASLGLSRQQLNAVVLIGIVLSFRFILYNLAMLQMTFFLLWGMLEVLRFAKQNKMIHGGVLLALIINIKVLPLVLLPYLFYRGYFKLVGFSLLFSLVFLFLPALFLGYDFNILLLKEWWVVINPSNAEHLIESELGPHSLTALLPSLLVATEGTLDFSRNIFNFSLSATYLITNLIRLAFISSTLYFLRCLPFKSPSSPFHQIREVAFLILLIPLVFPHQQKYAFLLALPAQLYITFFIVFQQSLTVKTITNIKFKWIIGLVILSFLLMTLTSDLFLGRELNRITQHYKLITYGAFSLMISLFLCHDNYFKRGLVKKEE